MLTIEQFRILRHSCTEQWGRSGWDEITMLLGELYPYLRTAERWSLIAEHRDFCTEWLKEHRKGNL